MKQAKPAKRSPIGKPSLGQPGDSLQRALYDHRMTLVGWAMLPVLPLAIAITEWLQYWWKTPQNPIPATTLFLAFLVYASIMAYRTRRRIDNLALGLRGERTVGQLLQTLQSRGYRVFHDVEQEDWNIDHVLIGPGGVFAIETKTISKPNDHDAHVVYDGQRVLIDGHTPDRDPIAQVLGCGRRLRQILREQTGQDVPVRPVVVFPGWYVERTVRQAEVYVCNDKWLIRSFDYEHGRRVLDDTIIKLLAAGMERYQQQT